MTRYDFLQQNNLRHVKTACCHYCKHCHNQKQHWLRDPIPVCTKMEEYNIDIIDVDVFMVCDLYEESI